MVVGQHRFGRPVSSLKPLLENLTLILTIFRHQKSFNIAVAGLIVRMTPAHSAAEIADQKILLFISARK